MLDGNDYVGYTLICDHCEEPAPETFKTFQEAVDYKVNNDWRSAKSRTGIWYELCPACQSYDIVRHYKDM